MNIRTVLHAIIVLVIIGCQDTPTPKPRAYARITMPEHSYRLTEGEQWQCPYVFEFSDQSAITIDPSYRDSTCWYNIYYPRYRATVHLTYTQLKDDLQAHLEDSRKLAMKHIGKASQIEEEVISNEEVKVYALVYDFAGETASDMQFFATDSTTHFLRGALYFNVAPNKDSLQPVIDYIKVDVRHLVQTLRWK